MKELKIKTEVIALINIERMCMDYLMEHPTGGLVTSDHVRELMLAVSAKIHKATLRIISLQDAFSVEQDAKQREKIAKKAKKLRREATLNLSKTLFETLYKTIEFSARMGRTYDIDEVHNKLVEYELSNR